MTTTILSSREFNRNINKAKKATSQGPVFITTRGKVSHVFMAVEEYRKISVTQTNIVDQLAMREADDIEFQLPKLNFMAQTM